MSNIAYTDRQGAALFAQFSKAMELVREGKRSPEFVSRSLQAIIGHNDAVTPSVIETAGESIFHITGNAASAMELIKSLNCPNVSGYANRPDEIPLTIQPVDCYARVKPLAPARTTAEAYKLYPKMLTPAEFFAFGAMFPSQRKGTEKFLTIWRDAKGQYWSACLGSYGDFDLCPGCAVNVNPNEPSTAWPAEDWYFVLERE